MRHEVDGGDPEFSRRRQADGPEELPSSGSNLPKKHGKSGGIFGHGYSASSSRRSGTCLGRAGRASTSLTGPTLATPHQSNLSIAARLHSQLTSRPFGTFTTMQPSVTMHQTLLVSANRFPRAFQGIAQLMRKDSVDAARFDT